MPNVEIPVLPDGMGTSTLTPTAARTTPPQNVEIALIKGQYAVLVDRRVVTRTPELAVAQEYAARVKSGDLSAQIPAEIPKSWARYVAPEGN